MERKLRRVRQSLESIGEAVRRIVQTQPGGQARAEEDHAAREGRPLRGVQPGCEGIAAVARLARVSSA